MKEKMIDDALEQLSNIQNVIRSIPVDEEVKEEKSLKEKISYGIHDQQCADIATQHFKEKFDRESNSWTCKLVSSEVIRKALFGEDQ